MANAPSAKGRETLTCFCVGSLPPAPLPETPTESTFSFLPPNKPDMNPAGLAEVTDSVCVCPTAVTVCVSWIFAGTGGNEVAGIVGGIDADIFVGMGGAPGGLKLGGVKLFAGGA
jgi:hypothetical protein